MLTLMLLVGFGGLAIIGLAECLAEVRLTDLSIGIGLILIWIGALILIGLPPPEAAAPASFAPAQALPRPELEHTLPPSPTTGVDKVPLLRRT